MATTYEFEKRAGSPGYVFGKSAEGKAISIYIQYSHPVAVARDNGISVEEATEMVAQARAFDLTGLMKSAEVPAEVVEVAKAEAAADQVQPEIPAQVLALIAKYGTSDAAWEAENESACFAMREYGY